jgi:hypothetical protein
MSVLIGRLQAAYDKVKFFPEDRPTGWINLIELRNVAAEAILELHSNARLIAQLRAERDALINAQQGTIGQGPLQG